MSRRTEMLGSTIQRELAEYIMRDLNDPRLPTITSITRVKVTDDLEYADVYISAMGTEGQQTAALNALRHSAGLMRSKLTRSLSLRQAPFIRFHNDQQLKKEMAILDLLSEVRKEWEPPVQDETSESESPSVDGSSKDPSLDDGSPEAASLSDESAAPPVDDQTSKEK